MAIIHDLPEVIVGDITPHDNISKQDKYTLENEAARTLFPAELYELWKEAQEGKSAESKYLKQLDKLDMGLQAELYDQKINVEEFISSAKQGISAPSLYKLLK